MPSFFYKIKDETGKTYHGLSEADEVRSLKKVFRDRGWFVIEVKPFLEQQKARLFKRGVGLDNLIIFTHQLTTMVEVGIPILRAMDILWRQTDDPRFQIVITQIRDRLSQGKSFSETFNEFPRIFPLLYRALLGVAETGANLAIILRKLTEYLTKQREFITKIKKATIYPAVVITFAILVVIGMLLFVVPTFQSVFKKLNITLPFLTRLILEISVLMRSIYFWLAVAAVCIWGAIFYKKFYATTAGRYKIDSLKLKIPILGKLFYTGSMVVFVRSLTVLISAGLPVDRSIEVAKTTAINTKIARALELVKERISEGISLGNALFETRIFSSFLVQMISVGEESGTLVEMLEKSCVHFEEELDYNLNKFVTALEPLLIIFVGGIVLFVLLSIYLPIFKLWQGIASIG